MKRSNSGASKGRSAKRRKDEYGYAIEESEESVEVPTEQAVAEAIAARYKGMKRLPKFFDKLHDDTRKSLVDAYTNSSKPDIGEFMPEIEAAKRDYNLKRKWDRASKVLGSRTYLAGGIADGDLVVLFLSIGNGDCIFIRTPGGNVIVVDCGTRKRPDGNYRKHVRDVLTTHFLKAKGTGDENPELYALILTHPDQDHYNELSPILAPAISAVRHLFHSDELTEYKVDPSTEDAQKAPSSKKAVKVKADLMTTQEFLRSRTIVKNSVMISSASVRLRTSNPSKITLPYVVNTPKKTIQILKEDKCEITLIAAGVSESNQADREVLAKDTRPSRTKGKAWDRYAKLLKAKGRGIGEDSNSGSIVTLIKAHGKKLLLCGDATYLTEIFLLKNHKETIREVELAQMQHHGSGTAHAGGVYVETLDPRFAVASAGTHEGDENPRWRAIEKYLGLKKRKSKDKPQEQRVVRLRTGLDAHVVHAHGLDKDLIDLSVWKPHENKGIYSTRSNGDICFKLSEGGELQLDSTKVTT